MPRSRTLALIWSTAARADLIRLREFIEPHNPEAARSAAQALKKATGLLVRHPGIGKRLEGRQDRELVVPFGQRGYIIRYRLDEDAVVIV
ncbi:MAG: type II toxin-antitoxin system RelE/ParE family toxin, partial [Gammaproteobacteria bacterium]|nr:type II toxin-antitoxin system RelE/ParE family toxin [Gammaproteobacteria bacterium]